MNRVARTGDVARVLVIDDDPNQARLIAWHLAAVPGKPYQVDSVSTFSEGAAAIAEGRHDAYLVDQRLGGAVGTDLIADARAAGSTKAMVVMTAHRDADSDRAALAAGADDFLIKGETDWKLLDRTLRYVLRIAHDRSVMAESATHIKALEQIGTLLTDDGPTPEVLAGSLEIIGHAYGFEHLAIYLMDHGLLRIAAHVGYARANAVIEPTGMIGQVLRTGLARFIPNATVDPDDRGGSAPPTELCVPLVVGHEPMGILLAGAPTSEPLGEAAHAVILTIGQRIALAAALDREHRELQAANRRFQHLARFARVASEITVWSDRAASAVLDILSSAVPADSAAIVGVDSDGRIADVIAIQGAEPRLAPDVPALLDQAAETNRSVVAEHPGRVVTVVPVALGSRVLAAIVLVRPRPLSPLEREVMPLLSTGLALTMSAAAANTTSAARGPADRPTDPPEDPMLAVVSEVLDTTPEPIGVVLIDEARVAFEAGAAVLADDLGPGERVIADGRGHVALVLRVDDGEALRRRVDGLLGSGDRPSSGAAGGSIGRDGPGLLEAARGALELAHRSGGGFVLL